ncbi:MAG: hypothetical protein CM15mP77_3510 [Synechococcus sp.]|nr:MAG: hypothetical protein CM15mP77_3510 [Synechococcus sp.]
MGLVQPLAAQELALLEPADTRIVLDLRRREITVVRTGQRWVHGLSPSVDPQTPTPQGTFSILSKQINPVYLSTKGGKPRKLVGQPAPSAIATLASIADRGEFGIMARLAPLGEEQSGVSLGCVRMLNATSVNSSMSLKWGRRCRFRADQASGRTSSKISLRISPAPCCLSLAASSMPMDSADAPHHWPDRESGACHRDWPPCR